MEEKVKRRTPLTPLVAVDHTSADLETVNGATLDSLKNDKEDETLSTWFSSTYLKTK